MAGTNFTDIPTTAKIYYERVFFEALMTAAGEEALVSASPQIISETLAHRIRNAATKLGIEIRQEYLECKNFDAYMRGRGESYVL